MPRREKENINYTIDDPSIASSTIDVCEIIHRFESTPFPETTCEHSASDEEGEYVENDDYYLTQIKDYELNYTTKQLGSIYEYYKIGSSHKLKKSELAQLIVAFENDEENMDIVERRQTLWFYIKELKNDSFTKKYIWAP